MTAISRCEVHDQKTHPAAQDTYGAIRADEHQRQEFVFAAEDDAVE